jgi:hypothetical protein
MGCVLLAWAVAGGESEQLCECVWGGGGGGGVRKRCCRVRALCLPVHSI